MNKRDRFAPKILIGIIVLFLVIAGGFIYFKRGTGFLSAAPDASNVVNETDTSNLEYYDGTAGANPSASSTPIPSMAPITQYIYPKAESISSSSAKLEMQTGDSTTKVMDWYKNKIASLKFNAQSASSTEVDGDILNKLSAAKPGEKIEVTIKKDQSTSNVLITVDRL